MSELASSCGCSSSLAKFRRLRGIRSWALCQVDIEDELRFGRTHDASCSVGCASVRAGKPGQFGYRGLSIHLTKDAIYKKVCLCDHGVRWFTIPHCVSTEFGLQLLTISQG